MSIVQSKDMLVCQSGYCLSGEMKIGQSGVVVYAFNRDYCPYVGCRVHKDITWGITLDTPISQPPQSYTKYLIEKYIIKLDTEPKVEEKKEMTKITVSHDDRPTTNDMKEGEWAMISFEKDMKVLVLCTEKGVFTQKGELVSGVYHTTPVKEIKVVL